MNYLNITLIKIKLLRIRCRRSSFELSLFKENVNILYHFKFRDHHNYNQSDINNN